MSDHKYFTIYITKNRRCPVLGLYGYWPARSAFGKLARAGVKLAVRETTIEEREDLAGAIRLMGMQWSSLRSMLREERDRIADAIGPKASEFWFRRLIHQIRENRSGVAACFKEVAKKKRQHQQELFDRRAQRQPAGFAV